MQAWESFVAALESEMGSATVEKWLKSLKILRFDAGNLYLEAKDTFQIMWFEEHVRQKVHDRLLTNNHRRIKVHLSIPDAPVKAKPRISKVQKGLEDATSRFTLTFDSLDPHCTFANFIVANSNQLTYQVFLETAKIRHSSSSLNPVFIHGPQGSGKTHLLMATATALREQGFHVIYTGAQQFTEHVVSAIRMGEMSLFRQTYRNSDVLIVDDVHLFSRKAATQEEFFHTFNTLHVAGKKIILSANCAPGELQFIEPRLVSRFEWGVALTLDLPPRDKMAEILQRLIEGRNFAVHQKVEDFLLDSFPTPKWLHRAVEALILRIHLNQQAAKGNAPPLTVILAAELLSDLIEEQQASAVTLHHIVQYVSEYFGIKIEDIFGKAQTRDCVLPRQIAMYFCRQELKFPYIKIGELFSRDHSTVMTSVKQIQLGIDADDSEIVMPCRAIMKKMRS